MKKKNISLDLSNKFLKILHISDITETVYASSISNAYRGTYMAWNK